jgi:hypothetical protein
VCLSEKVSTKVTCSAVAKYRALRHPELGGSLTGQAMALFTNEGAIVLDDVGMTQPRKELGLQQLANAESMASGPFASSQGSEDQAWATVKVLPHLVPLPAPPP